MVRREGGGPQEAAAHAAHSPSGHERDGRPAPGADAAEAGDVARLSTVSCEKECLLYGEWEFSYCKPTPLNEF